MAAAAFAPQGMRVTASPCRADAPPSGPARAPIALPLLDADAGLPGQPAIAVQRGRNESLELLRRVRPRVRGQRGESLGDGGIPDRRVQLRVEAPHDLPWRFGGREDPVPLGG